MEDETQYLSISAGIDSMVDDVVLCLTLCGAGDFWACASRGGRASLNHASQLLSSVNNMPPGC